MSIRSVPKRDIIVGEVFASAAPTRVCTLLGSCIAACLFDPNAAVGGMNHFLLPQQSRDATTSARFGVQAMELLINKIMNLGGDRRRLQAKVFGGANVLDLQGSSLRIGDKNCRFVLQFLETEGIPIASRRLGGDTATQVQFLTHTGKAFVRSLTNKRSRDGLVKHEKIYQQKAVTAAAAAPPDDITLF